MKTNKLTNGLIDYVESEKAHRQQAIKLFEEGYKQITNN